MQTEMTDRQTTHAPGCCDRRLAVDDLIERLRAVKWEEVYDDDRMPDDPTHKCVLEAAVERLRNP